MTIIGGNNLPRHEIWRLQYRQRPYLQDASFAKLTQRFHDVMTNLTTLTDQGKIGVLPVNEDGVWWMTLFTHILEEIEARGTGLPLAQEATLPTPTAPVSPPPVIAIQNVNVPIPKNALIKLGKFHHMDDLLQKGSIRIAPASSYSDPSLNPATQDDELKFDRILRGSDVTITVVESAAGGDKHNAKRLRPIGEVVRTTSLATDYYVYCMTHSLTYRLFEDFEADSCVIIRDPVQFCCRLLTAVKAQLPNWAGSHRPVEYIDPYLHKGELDLIFGKHFRHWYQSEYRFAWVPETGPQTQLEPLFVEVGSLKEIAEIIHL